MGESIKKLPCNLKSLEFYIDNNKLHKHEI